MTPAGVGVWDPAQRALTAALVMSIVLVAFEALSVATVMPVVARHLGDYSLYGWVFSAFMLTSLLGIVGGGALIDRFGARQLMLLGLTMFATGLVIGGLAPSMPVLVCGRAVQGLGAGVVPTVSYVVIGRGYHAEAKPRMLAVLSTAWVAPGLIGPAVATGISEAVGWRWVFLGLIPLVVVAGLVSVVSLGRLPAKPQTGTVGAGVSGARRGMLAVVLAGGATALLYGLDAASSGSLPVPAVVVLVIAGLLMVLPALRLLTPRGTLRAVAGVPATVGARGLLSMGFFAADAYVPLCLTTVRHQPTWVAGLTLTAATVTWALGSWVMDAGIRRLGPRRMVRTGHCSILAAILLTILVARGWLPPGVEVFNWALGGFGMGMAYSSVGTATLDIAGQDAGASSAMQLCDQLGDAIGIGVGGAAVAAGVGTAGLRNGVTAAFVFGAVVIVVAVVAGARLPAKLQHTGQP